MDVYEAVRSRRAVRAFTDRPVPKEALCRVLSAAAWAPSGSNIQITAILSDERGITGDTAIRLGTFFKTSTEFWMNLQMTYDLRNAEKALPARVRKRIEDNRSMLD